MLLHKGAASAAAALAVCGRLPRRARLGRHHHQQASFASSSASSSSSGSSSSPSSSSSSSSTTTAMSNHADFKTVEASRPPWDDRSRFRLTRTVDPDWALGDGPNRLHRDAAAATTNGASSASSSPQRRHVAIDPLAPGRAASANYKLLISAVVPRPIALISSRSSSADADADADAGSTKGCNLAPFSYFNAVGHDPPLFVVGFTGGAKDTLRNVAASREVVINLVGEPLLEAANAASVDAPAAVSEWPLAGLTPAFDCHTVRCPRVREAVVSFEVRLDSLTEYAGAAGAPAATTLAVFRATRFWVREDALDDGQALVDPAVLRPMSRMGGITYARTTEALEIPRPRYKQCQEAVEKLTGS